MSISLLIILAGIGVLVLAVGIAILIADLIIHYTRCGKGQ